MTQQTTISLVVSEFIILSIVCFMLVNYYQSVYVTKDVSLSVYFSWVLGFTGILLLPYDLSVAIVDHNRSDLGRDIEHSKVLNDVWAFIYWSTFLLAWVVLPIQMGYHSSGHFSFAAKLKDSVVRNLISSGLAILAGLIYLIYMLVSYGITPRQVISFLMALGNTYGVLLIIVLMGHGLVGLPKRLWQMSNNSRELNRLYMMAYSVEDAFQEARFQLEDCETEVGKAIQAVESRRLDRFDVEMAKYAAILKQRMEEFARQGNASSSDNNNRTSKPRVFDSSDIDVYQESTAFVKLHARLLQAQIQVRSSENRWLNLLRQCNLYEFVVNGRSLDHGNSLDASTWCEMPTATTAIKAATGTGTGIAGDRGEYSTAAGYRSFCQRFSVSLKYLHQLWLFRFRQPVCRCLSLVTGACSALILWSEMLLASPLNSPIAYLMGAYDNTTSRGGGGEEAFSVLIQAVAFVFLAYMSICTYWSLFRINLGWAYSLQGPQQSSPSSLIFNAEYFSRLQFTLGYNFLVILHASRAEGTSFSNLMNHINLIPVFGASFNVYGPLIMILVALLSFFNCYARLWKLAGVDSEDGLSAGSSFCSFKPGELTSEEQEQISIGKTLIANELRRLGRASFRATRQQGSASTTSTSSNTLAARSTFVQRTSTKTKTKDSLSILDDDDDDIEMNGDIDNNQMNVLHRMDKDKDLKVNTTARKNSEFAQESNESLLTTLPVMVSNLFAFDWFRLRSASGSQHGLLQPENSDTTSSSNTSLDGDGISEGLEEPLRRNIGAAVTHGTRSSVTIGRGGGMTSFDMGDTDVYVGRYAKS